VPKLTPEELPAQISLKDCLNADLECAYHMVNQNMKIIEDLISEGETNITSKNSKYLDAIKALRPINEDKTDVLFKLGFGFSRRFHPIAFHHAIKLYLFEGKED
jgi:hypothetical protein